MVASKEATYFFVDMRKFIVSVFALLSSLCFASAQDYINKTDGSKIKAKVEEITPEQIKYRLYDEPNGPLYVMNRSDVLLIAFESGRSELFQTLGQPEEVVRQNEALSLPNPEVQIPVEAVCNLSYSKLKKMYDPDDYVSSPEDRRSPFISGLCSFFIPGLGEAIGGEFWLGLRHFFAIPTSLFVGGMASALIGTPVFIIVGSIVAICTYVDSIWDAVDIAKLKNMYEQDMREGVLPLK